MPKVPPEVPVQAGLPSAARRIHVRSSVFRFCLDLWVGTLHRMTELFKRGLCWLSSCGWSCGSFIETGVRFCDFGTSTLEKTQKLSFGGLEKHASNYVSCGRIDS